MKTTEFKSFLLSSSEKDKSQSLLDIGKRIDFSDWWINQYITDKNTFSKKTTEEKRTYLKKRIEKSYSKKLEKSLLKLSEIENSKDIDSIYISIEWKRSQTWGSNPTAETKICYPDNSCEYFYAKASGCGYDKESTVFASSLNDSMSFLKLLFEVSEKDTKDMYGYYKPNEKGYFPHLSGGVGVSCYYKIFDSIGFTMEKTGSGKSFDCYKIYRK